MIRILMLIVTIACLSYGIYALVTNRLINKDLDEIAEQNKRKYSKICGVVMLAEGVFVGSALYMEITRQPYSKIILVFLILALTCTVIISKKRLKK